MQNKIIQEIKASFNPRICKRCDTVRSTSIRKIKSFNPRICKRCDYAYDVPNSDKDVSIHASVKDATMPMPVYDSILPFQSTHL